MRTINAPGIEINEIDRSYYNTGNAITAPVTFAMGFANKGDDYIPKYVFSMTDFINTYGTPENEAERYFYYAAKDTFENGGVFMAAKLPYNNAAKDQYKYIRYEVSPIVDKLVAPIENINSYRKIKLLSNDNGKYILNATTDIIDSYQVRTVQPTQDQFYIVDISKQKYIKDEFNKILKADEEETTINTIEENEYIGIIPVVVSPLNAIYFQHIIDNTLSCNPVDSFIYASKDDTSLSDIVLSGNIDQDDKTDVRNYFYTNLASDDKNIETVSKIAVDAFPQIVNKGPNTVDNEYLKNIGIVVFAMKQEPGNNGLVSFIPLESFIGSFDKNAKDKSTGLPTFIDDIVNSQSNFINVFSNITAVDINNPNKFDTFIVKDQPAVSFGFNSNETKDDIDADAILSDIDVILKKLENKETSKIDVLVDAGVSTIAQFTAGDNIKFDPVNQVDGHDIYNSSDLNYWRNVLNKYKYFCETTRKDCMFIADGPRNLCLIGNYPVVRAMKRGTSVKDNILPKIKYMSGIDTSYGAGYLDWFMCYDELRKVYIWLPPTIKMGGVYTRLDVSGNVWEAPAGMNNGVLNTVYDVAFNPTHSEAETIYLQNWNYAMSYPTTGPVPEGQKTFQRKKTAFDRVNVRRLFLGIERAVSDMSKSFLYERLSDYNIERFRTACVKILQSAQHSGGIAEYAVVCDTSNNTPETLDNNELHCAIGIKPYKSLEYIVLNFLCTSQGANVEEVVTNYLFKG